MATLSMALLTAVVTGTSCTWHRGFPKGGEENQCFTPWSGYSYKAWGNKIKRGTSYSLPIYTEANSCDHTKGYVSGHMLVTWPSSNQVRVEFKAVTGLSYKYVGFKIQTSRPGQNCGFSRSSWSTRVWTISYSSDLYIFGYAKLCEPANTPSPSTAPPACVPAANTAPVVKVKTSTTTTLSGSAVSANMLGWSINNDDQVILDQFADVYKLPGMKAYFPDQDSALASGAEFSVKCPENCENRGCEVIVTVYHCAPCSTSSNGGLPALIVADGWEAGSCAPRFRQPSKRHQMVAFRTLVAAGQTVTTPDTDKPLSNVAIYVRPGAVDCQPLSSGQCAAESECRWESGECVSNWCPTPPPGLPPVCLPCAPTGLQ